MAVKGKNTLFFANAFDNSGLKQGKIDAVNIVTSLAQSISKINPFAALAVGALAAFGTIASAAYDFARTYEAALLEVKTISSAMKKDFKGLGNEIFALSTETLDDPVKLAKAYYQIVSAGYDGAAGMKVLEAASKAAVAGVTDTQTAADGITTIMNAFKISVEEVDEVSDSMFKTVELGKTTFSEISASMAQAAPLAASLGVSYNEILAAAATLTKQGVPTSQAFTQMKAAMVGLNKALGDGWSEAYTFQEAMQVAFDEAGGSISKLTENVGSVEAVGAILATTGENAAGAAEDFDKLNKSAGATDGAFKDMMKGNLNQFTLLKNNIRALTEELGNFALAASSSFVQGMNTLFKDYNKVSKSINDQRASLSGLRSQILSNATPLEKRIELIEELKALYPDILKGIDANTVGNTELKLSIEKVNEALRVQMILQAQQEKINEETDNLTKKDLESFDLQNKIQDKTNQLRVAYNIQLQEGNTWLEDAIELQKKLKIAEGSRTVTGFDTSGGLGQSSFLADLLSDFDEVDGEIKELEKNIDDLAQRKLDLAVRFKVDPEGSNLASELEKQLKEIAAIENVSKLSQYLTSDNEVLRAAALARRKILRDAFGGGGGGAKSQLDIFTEYLTAQQKAYKDYEIQKEQLGQEFADRENARLLAGSETYFDLLQKELEATKDVEKLKAIARAAEDAGYSTLAGRAKLERLEFEIKPIVSWEDVDVDTTSINAINRLIDRLDQKRLAARTDKERKLYEVQIEVQRERLEGMKTDADDEMDIYETVTQELTNLTGKQLDDYISYWKKRLAVLKAGTDAEKEAAGNVAAAQQTKISRITENVVGNLSDLASAFRNFGDEGMAGLLDGLAQIGAQTENLFKSFSEEGLSKGEAYTQIASGVTSLATMVINSAAQRKKAEEAYYLSVISFQKEYNVLINEQLLSQEAINENVFTTDFVSRIENGIDALSDANDKYKESIDLLSGGQVKEGQRNAVDTGNLLGGIAAGAGIGAAVGSIVPVIGTAIGAAVGGIVGGIVGLFSSKKKDLFTGLLDEFPELVTQSADGLIEINEELANALLSNDLLSKKTKILVQDTLDWADKVKEAREQIDGVVSELAGGLGTSLRDALVGAFEDGSSAAEAMGQEVSTVLQGILEQLIFDQIFSDQFKNLQEEMSKSFDIGGDRSWVDDFGRFFQEGEKLTDDFNEALAAAQESGSEFGFDLFRADPTSRQGMTGEISTITEDTANVLGSTINGIRVDVNNGLLVARESVEYLGRIAASTSRMVEEQELSNVRLTSIEKSLS
tara:strand:+ start:15747 stop:19607 length:3861 start_codon:yes stop_codon:yes gene_type:complete